MRVNRIYFRGIKTFHGLFVLALFFAFMTGCGNMGKISIHTEAVAHTPQVVDFSVSGPCPMAQVSIEIRRDPQDLFAAHCRQVPAIQGERGWYRLRLNLDSIFHEPHQPSDQLRVVIKCQEHGDRVVDYQFPDQSLGEIVTPDWAKGLVWYQIFPERFRDGNPSNNPNSWDISPAAWDSAFGTAEIEEIERAWNRRLVDPRHYPFPTDRPGGAVASVVFARRYGGDLLGVYDKLEELANQGYTGIYLCPVFQSRSLHKYDADDHRHIDPTLGHPREYRDKGPGHTRLAAHEDASDETTWDWTLSDRWFVEVFLPKAKSLGLRVILDGVWNHVGVDHFAFSDVMEKGEGSEFADWFDAEFDDEGKLVAWQGWGRVNGNLPEFQQTSEGDLVAGPKAHIMAVTRRWMDPNGDGDPSDGIDGWRLDVAGEIGKAFWKDWRQQVRDVNPEALMIAEIWGDAGRVLNDEAFDGQMNYPFAYPIADWLSIGQNKGDAVVCAKLLNAVFHHEAQHDLVQFNLMTSHDTERLASMMQNNFVRGYDNDASRWAADSRYDPDTITPDDRGRALAAIAVMVASPGSPMIYNGDEYAMSGADDPDNRRPIPWGKLQNAEPMTETDVQIRFNQVVNDLIRLRSEPGFEDVLRYGDVEFIGHANGDLAGALQIRRQLNNRVVEFLIYSTPRDESVDSPWESLESPWHEVGERSRKYGVASKRRVADVRYMIEKIDPLE